MYLKCIITILILNFLISCGGGGSSTISINEGEKNTLSGKIENMEWTFQSGKVEESPFEANTFSYELYGTQVENICDSSFLSIDLVGFSTPNKVGTYQLKFEGFSESANNVTVTLFDSETTSNNIATSGQIVITTITDTEVTGSVKATIDGSNFVDGTFTATLCTK